MLQQSVEGLTDKEITIGLRIFDGKVIIIKSQSRLVMIHIKVFAKEVDYHKQGQFSSYKYI